jgi:hypothetical protein
VNYPSLGCSGDLILISSNGDNYEFREHITSGDCVDGIRIVIKKVSNRVATYEAFWPDDSQLNAKGKIRLQ